MKHIPYLIGRKGVPMKVSTIKLSKEEAAKKIMEEIVNSIESLHNNNKQQKRIGGAVCAGPEEVIITPPPSDDDIIAEEVVVEDIPLNDGGRTMDYSKFKEKTYGFGEYYRGVTYEHKDTGRRVFNNPDYVSAEASMYFLIDDSILGNRSEKVKKGFGKRLDQYTETLSKIERKAAEEGEECFVCMKVFNYTTNNAFTLRSFDPETGDFYPEDHPDFLEIKQEGTKVVFSDPSEEVEA